jgi:hypothetical protein
MFSAINFLVPKGPISSVGFPDKSGLAHGY